MLTASSNSRPPKGLAEKPHGAELSGLVSGIRAIERGDEDHRRVDSFAQELTSQVQTRLVWKVNVENEASCQRRDVIAQALGGGGKRSDREPSSPEHTLDRRTHAGVILDDHYRLRCPAR